MLNSLSVPDFLLVSIPFSKVCYIFGIFLLYHFHFLPVFSSFCQHLHWPLPRSSRFKLRFKIMPLVWTQVSDSILYDDNHNTIWGFSATNRIILHRGWSNEWQHFFIKICHFKYFLGVNASMVCERRTETGTEYDRLPYWRITSFLDHSTLSYLQDPNQHFFCFLAGVAQTESSYGPQTPADRSQRFQVGSESALIHSNWFNYRGHRHILFHNVHFQLNHVVFFRLFTHLRLWLTARSRVNM